ncbi:MAG: sodium/hydrogen exchanger [Candidatus Parvarchaeum acidophilus ARMAN-5]|jgi:cell volume regulation protein A|uniref:Sodium/hydrogen exchanger n=1 Tax=Candidatus Parvarchaeum acidophilus ARMAN-5 TaxID=662762 RepID=D6GWH1_PARA5|nr:MAG: sodium/hydrogen exchanger [Candidatus Parvarchaeum acidophilus ARMAN-5]
MVDSTTFILLVSALIIFLGYIGEQIFKKTHIPSFLFLVLAGFILGPVLKVLQPASLIPLLGILAEVTLMMVIFHGGMDLKARTLLKDGWRPFVQVAIYVSISIILVTIMAYFLLHFSIVIALIFGSIVGGETTTVVIIPLSRELDIKEKSIMFLTFEAALNSIILVILFLTFVGLYQSGTASVYSTIDSIVSTFSIGIFIGLVLSIIWIYLLNFLKKQKYTYVLTLGLLFLTFGLTQEAGGSGYLAVIIFGIVFGNHKFISELFRKKIRMDQLEKKIFDLQSEITFILKTFFFVFLGLILSLSFSSLYFGLEFGAVILGVLLIARTIAVYVSTHKSDMVKDRIPIFISLAQGLTPATLAILALEDGIPQATTFLILVTYVIIFTNVVTTAGAFISLRGKKVIDHN